VINVVPGFGATAGAAVSSHMDIDAVSEILNCGNSHVTIFYVVENRSQMHLMCP
jgi:uncharacterized protein (DUF1786 family)